MEVFDDRSESELYSRHSENERCDELALAALRGDNLLEDVRYNPKDLISEIDQDFNGVELTKGPKVNKEGDSCRKCSTAIIKSRPKKMTKPGQIYNYEFFLYCPGCKTTCLI